MPRQALRSPSHQHGHAVTEPKRKNRRYQAAGHGVRAWTFGPDKWFGRQYQDDPEAQKYNVSKLHHDRLAQIGANGKVRNVIDGLVEARSDEELDLINELVNAVIHTDDTETVIPLLRAAVASINKAVSQ